MKQLSINLLFVLSFVMLICSCGKDDSEGDNSKSAEGYTIKLLSKTLTEKGYLDKNIYYKILSETSQTATITQCNNVSEEIKIPQYIVIDDTKKYTITTIGAGAFSDCKQLKSIIIPSSITKIGAGAFGECKKLESVYIYDLSAWCNIDFSFVENYSSNPLLYAQSLFIKGEEGIDLVVPQNATTIKNRAFVNYQKLKSIHIPNSVQTIGTEAFLYCTGLTSVSLSNNLISLEGGAFSYCGQLKSITIPNSVTKIGNAAFAFCGNLKSVVIGNNVKTIGSNAFESSGLTSISIPNSVQDVGWWAFSHCSLLKKVVIGDNVKTIGSNAFEGCSLLEDVYCLANSVPKATNNEITGHAFNNCNLGTLHVPSKSIDAYRQTYPWNLFNSIVAIKDNEEF